MPDQHNYVKRIHEMWATGALPRSVGLHQVIVEHDDWCHLLLEQGVCNCDPIVRPGWSVLADADN